MLAPIAQMVCSGTKVRPPNCARPRGVKVNAGEMTKTSTQISHNPRLSRKAPSTAGLLRAVISPALVPARKMKTGAQSA